MADAGDRVVQSYYVNLLHRAAQGVSCAPEALPPRWRMLIAGGYLLAVSGQGDDLATLHLTRKGKATLRRQAA